jgi:hypothetical protein
MRFLFRRRLPPSHPRSAGDRHWCGGKTINRSLAPFSILITRSFHQDRLGTNVEKVEKEEGMRFSQSRTLRCRRSPAARTKGCLCTAREGCQVGLITPVWRWSGPTSRGWGTPWCVLPCVRAGRVVLRACLCLTGICLSIYLPGWLAGWLAGMQRTARYRYTEWVRWNGTSLSPIWSQLKAAELYDHKVRQRTDSLPPPPPRPSVVLMFVPSLSWQTIVAFHVRT